MKKFLHCRHAREVTARRKWVLDIDVRERFEGTARAGRAPVPRGKGNLIVVMHCRRNFSLRSEKDSNCRVTAEGILKCLLRSNALRCACCWKTSCTALHEVSVLCPTRRANANAKTCPSYSALSSSTSLRSWKTALVRTAGRQ